MLVNDAELAIASPCRTVAVIVPDSVVERCLHLLDTLGHYMVSG